MAAVWYHAKRKKWVADYRDTAGRRRCKEFRTKRQADDFLAQRVVESLQRTRPAVDPDITVSAYAERWKKIVSAGLKSATVRSYEGTLRLHVLPAFGPTKVRQIVKGRVRELLAEKLAWGLCRWG